jgi:hypothetical protein
MNFNIYINDELGHQLAHVAEAEGKSRNALIRDALSFYLKNHTNQCWPNEVLSFSGISKDFPSFESFRSELKPATETALF